MNLLAKSLGQLAMLAVALFFFSCEDPTSIGIPNPTSKFSIFSLDIPLETSSVLLDSVITDNRISLGRVEVGKYHDNVMGDVTAQAYLQMYNTYGDKLPPNAEFEYATVQFHFNFYSYGLTGKDTVRFTVHEVTDILNIDSTFNYFYNSSVAFDQSPLGQINVGVDYDSLTANISRAPALQDTLVAEATLDHDFGQRVFNFCQQNEFKSRDDASRFFAVIKGLALVPTADTKAVVGINITSGYSNMVLHFHTQGVQDTLQAAFSFANLNFNNPAFTRIEADRTGTALAGLQPYQSTDFGNERYIQSGAPVVSKIDIANIYKVFDTLNNVLINSAELVIENVDSPPGFGVVPAMTLMVMNENNQFANVAYQADRDAHAKDRVYFFGRKTIAYPLGKYLAVQNDNFPSEPFATVGYSSTDKKYSTFATLFTQNLFNNSKTVAGTINETRIKYLALFPYAPTFTNLISGTVNRSVFDKNNIKLRLTYTKPTNLDH
jgi:hypothetical protein